MKRRLMGMGVLVATFCLAALATGCSGSDGSESDALGTLNLPLSTFAASGTQYRLRDAAFEIGPEYWSCVPGTGGTGGFGAAAGTGSGGPCPETITVSSEDDPDATSIEVSLERGYYIVRLLPGWRMEKVEDGTATDVETQLLSSDTQWVYVQERASTWVEFQFGIGGRELWFNGDLNINIRVFEDPSEVGYGTGGYGGVGVGGSAGTGGFGAGGTWAGTGGTGG